MKFRTTLRRPPALVVIVFLSSAFLPAAETRSARSDPPPEVAAWRVLNASVVDKNVAHRQAAISALAILKSSPRALLLAESGLDDKEVAVREAAAFSLGQMGSKRAVPRLRQALDDPSTQVRFETAKALWALGDHSGRSVLLDVLEGKSSPSDGTIKSGLEYASKKLHDPKALAWTGISEASSAFLGPFSLGLVAVEQFSKDKSAPARAVSASLLGADRDPDSLRELQDSLQDSNWVVRREAAKALGQRTCKNVIPDLRMLLEDHHEAVKCMAAAAIVNIAGHRQSSPGPSCIPPAAPVLAERTATDPSTGNRINPLKPKN